MAASSTAPTLDGQSTQALLAQVRLITAKTPHRDVYRLFLETKQRFHEHPEELEAIDQERLITPPKDEAERRQLSLMFGALAQSDQPQAWPYIAHALQANNDEFIGFQAVSAASDFAQPPHEAYELLSAVYHKHPNEEIRNSAFLAMGSIARANHAVSDQIVADIVESFAGTDDPWQLDVALAAAGNHGDVRYLPYIQKSARHSSDMVRARAVFAARRINDPTVTRWIVETAAADTSPRVQMEAIKALADRAHLEGITMALGDIGAKARDHAVLGETIRQIVNRLPDESEMAKTALVRLRPRAAADADMLKQIDEAIKI
jgi:HEAT repeat protein